MESDGFCVDTDYRNAWCDSCNGCIAGARLFCLDCANKNTEVYDALDLCSRPECIASRVTNREDLEGTHEPNHKLVKVRTVVLKRQHGRVHVAARKAFEHVEKVCKQIAEASNQSETGSNKMCAFIS
jgi:polysaccharide pyruvyl transferase WcaK-like protein